MRTQLLDRSSALLRGCLAAAAVIYTALYVVIALFRIRYPFELEWIEGCSLEQVARILSGRRLYVPPSVDFVPVFYPPLYFYVSAAVASLIGPGFFPLRLVSLAASIGCFALVFAAVKRETGGVLPALVAMGFFAATFRLSGAWFDLARIDSLFLFFLLLGVYLARFSAAAPGHAAAAAALALAVLTKQTAVFAAVVLAAYYVVWNTRYAAHFVGSLLLLVVGAHLALDAVHGGWYSYYTLGLSSAHQIVKRSLVLFWTRDVFARLGIVSVLAAFWLGAEWLSAGGGFRFYAAAAAALIGTSLGSRMNPGGYDNVLMPAHAILAVLFGLATHRLATLIRSAPADGQGALGGLLSVACLAQFAGLAYNPMAQVPRREDLKAGQALVERIRGLEGDVFLPGHPYLLTLAGKKSHASIVGLFEILAHTSGEVSLGLMDEVRGLIRERRFGAIILDSRQWFVGTDRCYRESAAAFESGAVFWPLTGARLRPELIYLPRDDGPCELPADITGRRGSR